MAGGEDEAVPAQPTRVAWVVPEEALEEQVCGGREAHRRAGVAVADLLHSIHREDPDGVNGPPVEIGPFQGALLGHGIGLLSADDLGGRAL